MILASDWAGHAAGRRQLAPAAGLDPQLDLVVDRRSPPPPSRSARARRTPAWRRSDGLLEPARLRRPPHRRRDLPALGLRQAACAGAPISPYASASRSIPCT